MDMPGRLLTGAANPHRPLGEPPETDHAVIHDERAGDRQIDAEARGNADDEIAALLERRRQADE